MRRLACLVLPFALSFAAPVSALEARFEVRYGILHVADVTVLATEGAQDYAAEGHVVTTGLVGLLREVHLDLSVEGTRQGDSLRPRHYRGDVDTGRRQIQSELAYDAGVPRILALAPPEPAHPWDIAAADQGGTLDPMSALYTLLRPRAETPCGQVLDLFDGRRHSRLRVEAAHVSGDAAQCSGAYIRVGGYSPTELQDYQALAFSLDYQRDADGDWQLARIVTHTPYGRMRVIRQF